MRRPAAIAILVGALWAIASSATAVHAQGAADCGWIGVSVQPMTRAFAASLGMNEPYGAIFGAPHPDSPAARAHIQAYDVVTAINGAPLRTWRDFEPRIAAFAPRTTIYLTTWRSRQSINRQVTLGAAKCDSMPKSPH
jgi:serine protease Do